MRPFGARSVFRLATLCATLLGGLPPILAAQTSATMVADIGQAPPDQPAGLEFDYRLPITLPATLGPSTYFYTDDGIHGLELWRSDGSVAGTSMVADLCPGRCGSAYLASQLEIARAGDRIYFAADDGVHGPELWALSGSGGPPFLVADLRPGARGSDPSSLQSVGDRVFFTARHPEEGSELWVSDGTAPGTRRVADLVPGPGSFRLGATAALDGLLIFGAQGPLAGLWRSDGTASGTYSISTMEPWQNSWPQGAPFLVLGDSLLFMAMAPGQFPGTLWVSDGTAAGTLELAPISGPWAFASCNGTLFLTSDFGERLWRTGGTPESTAEILLPAGLEIQNTWGLQACAGDRLVFVADDGAHGREPWVADATSAALLLDLAPGPGSSLDYDYGWTWGGGPFLSTLGGHVVLLADDGAHGREPWITDGTSEGTHLVSDTIPGPEGLAISYVTRVLPRAVVNGALVYREEVAGEGARLWRTDGTAAGTWPLVAIENQTSIFSPPVEGLSIYGPHPPGCFAPAGRGLIFDADDGTFGREPWVTDGTSSGTARILDFAPGPASSWPSGCHPNSGRSVFAAWTNWSYDASLAAWDGETGVVETLATGIYVGPDVAATRFEESLYLALSAEVWKTSGHPEGSTNLGAAGMEPMEVVSTGEAIFSGTDFLYRVSEDEGLVALAGPGEEPPYPTRLTPFGNSLLFFAGETGTGNELWHSDGTVEGTHRLADLRPGPASAIVEDFYYPGRPSLTRIVPLGPIALFAADDGVHGEELWRTDGTAAGTVMVRDVFPGAYPSAPRELVRVGDLVLFTAEDPVAGRELWVSNGTSVGTRRVVDLVPGTGSSVPQELAAIRDELWLSAWTPAFGREPWRVRRQGVGFAVERLADLAPGPLSSSPLIFRNAGDDVYTVANDNVHGFELWKLRDLDLLFADDFESSGLAHWASSAP